VNLKMSADIKLDY